MCLWTLETAPESRSGVERTQDTSGCTNIKRLASIGSLFQVGTLSIFTINILDIFQHSIGSPQCLRLDRGQREVRGGGGRPHCGQHGNGGEHDVEELRRWDQIILEALQRKSGMLWRIISCRTLTIGVIDWRGTTAYYATTSDWRLPLPPDRPTALKASLVPTLTPFTLWRYSLKCNSYKFAFSLWENLGYIGD